MGQDLGLETGNGLLARGDIDADSERVSPRPRPLDRDAASHGVAVTVQDAAGHLTARQGRDSRG